ncbi:MAG: oxidoreductase [Bryobacterales bacterium]|nr:oxidoreductase [Bryobacterales bacterium]
MEAVLESSRELAPGVRHFDFVVPSVARLEFAAGQFVSFSHDIAGKRITRAYSISSAPRGDNRFSLCLNLVPDGLFSPFLFAMQPGEAVAMQGPLGTFTLRDPSRDMVWVATGTGIAPFRGMLDAWLALPRGERGAVTLIFGARYPETLLYGADFSAAAAANPDFTFIPTLSRPPEHWPGARGHVQPHVLAAIGERRDLQVYICGLKAMVDDLRAQLKALGFDRRQVVYEKFD